MPRRRPGIYVAIDISSSLESVWHLSQTPELHERWDLRFTRIIYLPRTDSTATQHFLYETRIAFGLRIRGTGETIGEHASGNGSRTSALEFSSQDPKSLIRRGSGYWKYLPVSQGVRFFTWYDYEVRFGPAGRLLDRIGFRPLIGWATAWSFDRLRLWAELGQTPESTTALSLIHVVARIVTASIWIWQGLIPKLVYRRPDELLMLARSGVPQVFLPWIGLAEIAFGLTVLFTWRGRHAFLATIVLMILASTTVALRSPEYLVGAFNPVTLNLGLMALALIGWISYPYVASSRRCRRSPQEDTP